MSEYGCYVVSLPLPQGSYSRCIMSCSTKSFTTFGVIGLCQHHRRFLLLRERVHDRRMRLQRQLADWLSARSSRRYGRKQVRPKRWIPTTILCCRNDGKAFGSRQTVCLLLPVSVCAEIVTDGKWQWNHAGLFVARSRLRPITRDNGGTRDVELASNTCRLVVD